MRKISLAFALASLVPAASLAKPPAEVPFPDQGLEVNNPYDYEANGTWTQPPAEGLRDLAVDDASAFLRALTPTAAAEDASGKGNLILINRSSGWADIQVNGQELGVLGPLAFATLHGLKAGQYEISYTLTTGYTWTETLSTCGDCHHSEHPAFNQ